LTDGSGLNSVDGYKDITAKVTVSCAINGENRTLHVYPLERLLDVLREQLRLTGTKEGCGEANVARAR